MAHVVDTLTLYTLENELITCVTATASLVCWLIMPNNLMFLSLHFLMAKLYANSLLISLNTRKELREMRWTKSEWDRTVPVLTADDFRVPSSRSYAYGVDYGDARRCVSPSVQGQPACASLPAGS